MISDRGKKAKPGDEDLDQPDGELVLSIEKLQEVQDELEKVNEEASDKVLEIEQKYNEIRRPVYIRRNEIVKSIPDFWLTAFLSHPALYDILTEEDQKIFKYLDFLEVEDFKDVKSGYSICFNFKQNPYFENSKLTKIFSFLEEGGTKISGTNINWKEGLGISNGVNHDKKGSKRPVPKESFFRWLSESREQVEVMQQGFHDEVGEIIKEDLWPNPLKYFQNEANEEDEDEEEEEEEDDDDDDNDDDDNEA